MARVQGTRGENQSVLVGCPLAFSTPPQPHMHPTIRPTGCVMRVPSHRSPSSWCWGQLERESCTLRHMPHTATRLCPARATACEPNALEPPSLPA